MTTLIEKSHYWLKEHACAYWLTHGTDWQQGGFYECIQLDGKPLIEAPRRVMVQARQIYSLRVALSLNCCDREKAVHAIEAGIQRLISKYSLASGAFAHSVNQYGSHHDTTPYLYSQAFALFGMAHAYAVCPSPEIKSRAYALLHYLKRERQIATGGFSECLNNDDIAYQSNPHMHLFEAAIAWMEVDQDERWRLLADDVLALCLAKFIRHPHQLLCEHFDKNWEPLLIENQFYFEPGHQYEWAWLMGNYEKLTGINLYPIRHQLFQTSENNGICATRHMVYDEVWNDFRPKRLTSRFWPQCERMKAALQLGNTSCTQYLQTSFAKAADEALESLFTFFDLPVKGLWYDVLQESGEYRNEPAKASSFYHIIGALSEYIQLRERLESPITTIDKTPSQVSI